MVSCTLYFDALIIELFKICLVMIRILEKVYFQRCFKGEVKEFHWPGGQVNRLVKKFNIYWG